MKSEQKKVLLEMKTEQHQWIKTTAKKKGLYEKEVVQALVDKAMRTPDILADYDNLRVARLKEDQERKILAKKKELEELEKQYQKLEASK